jgi:hypothetical protein
LSGYFPHEKNNHSHFHCSEFSGRNENNVSFSLDRIEKGHKMLCPAPLQKTGYINRHIVGSSIP